LGPFVAFNGIFVNTNPTKGLFVAPSGISVNANPTGGIKRTSSPTSPLKGGEGEVEGAGADVSALFLFHLLSHFALPSFVG